MKNAITLAGILAVITWSCQDVPTKTTTERITDSEIRHILSEWERGYQEKDSSIMSRILHKDYIYAGDPSGNLTNRTQYLRSIPKGDYLDFQFAFDSLDFKYYDDIAVIRGRETITIVSAPTDSTASDTLTLKLRFTDVYQKENGVARALSTHSSPIE